jgi:hypothetical protein
MVKSKRTRSKKQNSSKKRRGGGNCGSGGICDNSESYSDADLAKELQLEEDAADLRAKKQREQNDAELAAQLQEKEFNRKGKANKKNKSIKMKPGVIITTNESVKKEPVNLDDTNYELLIKNWKNHNFKENDSSINDVKESGFIETSKGGRSHKKTTRRPKKQIKKTRVQRKK